MSSLKRLGPLLAAFALALTLGLASGAAFADHHEGAANPCGANPCDAKKAENPCNPCAAQNPCNPCAGNPCNPCAEKKAGNPCAGK